MTVDVVPDLLAALDGLETTSSGHTVTFNAVSWGRHFDGSNWGSEDGVITCRTLADPTRPANIGGGAELNQQNVEIIAWFADNPSLTDLDEFKRQLLEDIRTVVQSNEAGLVDETVAGVTQKNYFLSVRGHVDVSDLVRTNSGPVLRNQLNITVTALGTAEGWA